MEQNNENVENLCIDFKLKLSENFNGRVVNLQKNSDELVKNSTVLKYIELYTYNKIAIPYVKAANLIRTGILEILGFEEESIEPSLEERFFKTRIHKPKNKIDYSKLIKIEPDKPSI